MKAPGSKSSRRLWWWVAAAFALQFSAWAAWLVLAAHHPVANVPLVGIR
jgi:hypothetical protein